MGILNFTRFFRRHHYSDCKSAMLPSDLGLDPNFSYFLLHASYGDKWYILSYLPELFRLQEKVKIIASTSDEHLIRIFLGEHQLGRSVVLWDPSRIEEISSKISPFSPETNQLWLDLGKLVQTDAVITNGFPVNTLRHLHIVKYPYFSDLHLYHGVPYDTLLKMLLYLPGASKPVQPTHYTAKDIELTDAILRPFRSSGPTKIIIFNVVNISHLPLSDDQIEFIINEFENNEIKVLLNLAGHQNGQNLNELVKRSSWAGSIDIPAHLMALVLERVHAVFGVIGGAMNVSVYFSRCHTLSLHTDAVGFDLTSTNLYAGQYTDNLWRIEETTRPFMFEGRVIKSIEMGNPQDIDNNMLSSIVSDFVSEI